MTSIRDQNVRHARFIGWCEQSLALIRSMFRRPRRCAVCREVWRADDVEHRHQLESAAFLDQQVNAEAYGVERLGFHQCPSCGYIARALDDPDPGVAQGLVMAGSGRVKRVIDVPPCEWVARRAEAEGRWFDAFEAYREGAWAIQQCSPPLSEGNNPVAPGSAHLGQDTAGDLGRLLLLAEESLRRVEPEHLFLRGWPAGLAVAVRVDLLRRTGDFHAAQALAHDALASLRTKTESEKQVRDMLSRELTLCAIEDAAPSTIELAFISASDHAEREDAIRAACQLEADREEAQRAEEERVRMQAWSPERLVQTLEAFMAQGCPESHVAWDAIRARSAHELCACLRRLPIARDIPQVLEALIQYYGWPPQPVFGAMVSALCSVVPSFRARCEDFLELIPPSDAFIRIRDYLTLCLRESTPAQWSYRAPARSPEGDGVPRF